MNYAEFKEEMKSRIREFLPERYRDYDVDIIPVRKNNGVIKDGLMVRGRKAVIPTVCLNDFYEAYKAGASLKDILGQAAEIYQTNLETYDGLGTRILEYEKVREHLTVTVCNADKNAELLKHVPHEIREDLALVYRVNQPVADQAWESAVVNYEMLRRWNVGEQEVKARAWECMKRNSAPAFSSMEAVITNELFDFPQTEADMEAPSAIPLYVLSNKERIWGAAYMFDRETMAGIAERLDSSLIILPSSIHEALIIPESAENSREISDLQDLVKLVNRLALGEQEVLSDNVYRFDREDQTLTMFRPMEQSQGMNLSF